MSATMAECGWCALAILARFVERSEPMINTSGLTSRYFPLPHPMSRPMDPGCRP